MKERLNLEAAVNQHVETIDTLNSRIAELQDTCLAKATRITTLEEKNLSLESDTREAKLLATKAINDKDAALRESKHLEIVKQDLEAKVELLTSEMVKLEKECR